MTKALLVIDMQNVCVGEKHASFFKYDDKLISNVNDVINKNKDNYVFYIQNVMKNNFINKLAPVKAFDGTEEIELAKELNVVSGNIYKKYEGNAFSNPDFKAKLAALNVDEIELVGLDGGGCIAATALGAINEGYKVIINQKAIGTMFEKKAKKYNDRLKKLGACFI